MYLEQISNPLTKAFQQGNSPADAWSSFDATGSRPEKVYTDGTIVTARDMEIITAQRLFVMPYCEGPGLSFSMRVYGWQEIARPDPIGQPAGKDAVLVWIPFLIVELACTSCNRAGPDMNRLLRPIENLCDTITVTQGTTGFRGNVVSTGPGTDLVAWAVIELVGARRITFDFSEVDQTNCNALWAKVS